MRFGSRRAHFNCLEFEVFDMLVELIFVFNFVLKVWLENLVAGEISGQFVREECASGVVRLDLVHRRRDLPPFVP